MSPGTPTGHGLLFHGPEQSGPYIPPDGAGISERSFDGALILR